MAYFIRGNDCMIVEWIFFVVAYAFVAARIYVRLFCLRKRLNWSELLLVASALDALGLIVCDTLTFQMGVLDDYQTSEKLYKISFASNYFYDFGLGLPKLSMLAFYWTFFDVNRHRTVRKVLLFMIAFVVACYLTSLLDDTFFCGKDISVQWSQEKGACSVFYAQEPFILNFTLGLTCYLIIYMLPTTLLIRGILETSTAVVLTLAIGALPIVTGVVRYICLKVGTGQENLVYILSMAELALAIIVASLPGLKIFWVRDNRGSRRGVTATAELGEDTKSSESDKTRKAVSEQV
ncbi:hypothetical protein AA0113_g12260 [Alternaria arborescens]|uniref:Rhodopsin domain-containing protein n=1 Tax=Alternaria arborescens TaxID=156630 RepID=A0A4Q4PXT8_9PLEO|nr:hypothetical protein AA0113_g12260 [Alternaria arborescens]